MPFNHRPSRQKRLGGAPGRWLAWLTWQRVGVEGSAGDLASVLLGTGVPVLAVGLVFGWLWDRYRNLPSLIATHWGIDVLPSVSSFLGIRF